MFVQELDTPSVIIDLDIMERNLQHMSDYCRLKELSLRPHTKTHKILGLAHRQVEGGAVGITVAKLSEARVMVEAGFQDLLVAYPIVTETKAKELTSLAERAKISVSLDSSEAVDAIATQVKDRNIHIGILVEVDVGFHRCGVADERQALSLARRVMDSPNLDFAGLMFYPGHLLVPPGEQTKLIGGINNQLSLFYETFDDAGIPIEIVSGGSTPTAFQSHGFLGLTEIRPGMYVFNDRNMVGVEVARIPDCALSVLVTVVSTAVKSRAIIDGGSKAFSSDLYLRGAGRGFGIIKEDSEAEFASMSEEHGHLDITRSSRSYSIGERLTIIPNHVCSTINMHDEIYGIRGDRVEEVWRVAARGKVR
jgi:D-serine deaminase-like pyridoxal phosphate-dependent protein